MDNNQASNYVNTFIVTTNDDENDGVNSGGVSLREAIAAANNSVGADRILFDESLSDSNIVLELGEIDITDSVAIDGLHSNITIDGNNASRIFHINDRNRNNELSASLANLTITNGTTGRDGGAIRNEENLVIKNSTISNNTANSLGGGIYNQGNLQLQNTTITGNTADEGGGIYNSRGVLDVHNTTIANNQAAQGGGGGIYNENEATISSSTISENTASSFGSGIANIGSKSRVNLKNSTVYNNYAQDMQGSSIAQFLGELSIASSIVVGNSGRFGDLDFFSGEYISGGNNLIGNGRSEDDFISVVDGDIVGSASNPIDPKLGALQDNGGATQTHALLEGSPAINAGSNPDNLSFDQRGEGFARTVGTVDIGAFENQNQNVRETAESDILSGASGDDTISGLDGDDTVRGEAGNDDLIGGVGDDLLDGGLGNDLLDGGSDRDVLIGDDGDDTLSGGAERDVLLGNAGADLLDGGSGKDIILGGTGSDTIFGRDGTDMLYGDGDSDRFVLESSQHKDFILDFEDGIDFLALDSSLKFSDLNITDFASGVMIQDSTNDNLAIAFISRIDAANLTQADFTTL